MTAAIRPVKTPAEVGLSEAFVEAKDRLPGGGAVALRREAAIRLFEKTGLPTRRVEEWKYTDLRAAMREAQPLAVAPPATERAAAFADAAPLGFEARRLVFINGFFAPELSDLASFESGIAISSLAQALRAGDADLVARISVGTSADNDPAMELNTAFMSDGALIRIAEDAVLERPIHLDFHFTGAAAAAFPRSVLVAGRGARATLIETFHGPQGCAYQVNAATEIAAADGAQVAHVKIMSEGDKALHVGTLFASLGEGARFSTFAFSIGGAVARNQSFLRCDGKDADLVVSGASLLRGRQHVDNTLVVDHAVGGCVSREAFRSVLGDEATGVFQGKIIVRADAQKTDARMMSRALLLSDTAEAVHKPELEIFADDVQCGHGATAGAIDEALLFYLMARGIPRAEAESLLIEAFIGEVVDDNEHEGVRDVLMERVRAWLRDGR